jgi:hypothetical protein
MRGFLIYGYSVSAIFTWNHAGYIRLNTAIGNQNALIGEVKIGKTASDPSASPSNTSAAFRENEYGAGIGARVEGRSTCTATIKYTNLQRTNCAKQIEMACCDGKRCKTSCT